MYKRNAEKQFKCTFNDIRSLLQYLCKDYCVVAEVTKQGNVHYHAWCIFKESYEPSMFIDAIKNNFKFGYSMFSRKNPDKDACQQKSDMLKYLIKDLEKTYRYVRSLNIIFHEKLDPDDIDNKNHLELNEAYNLNII